jgi:hypothetical protein
MGHEPAMTAAESAVRAAWERVESRWTAATNRVFCITLPCIWFNHLSVGYFRSEEEGWEAALAFTLERQEEIRQLEAAIREIEGDVAFHSRIGEDQGSLAVYRFILAILQEKLTEASRGMKGAA